MRLIIFMFYFMHWAWVVLMLRTWWDNIFDAVSRNASAPLPLPVLA